MPSEYLTPNTVLLVLLLNELNELNETEFDHALNKFVIDRILVCTSGLSSQILIFCRIKPYGITTKNSLTISAKKPKTHSYLN